MRTLGLIPLLFSLVVPTMVLAAPEGPVILDAECAWYGDPAFDLAFVLNHLLLKGVWQPQWRRDYAAMFQALVSAYQCHVLWEPWPAIEARTAGLLPGLLLARVDGKSPAEYVTADADRDAIRRFARAFVADPPASLERLVRAWSP